MVATEFHNPQVAAHMPEPGTKTVRIDSDAATKLLTVASLKAQMGKRFKTVEFLNKLVVKAINDVYQETLAEFDEFRGIPSKAKKPPKS